MKQVVLSYAVCFMTTPRRPIGDLSRFLNLETKPKRLRDTLATGRVVEYNFLGICEKTKLEGKCPSMHELSVGASLAERPDDWRRGRALACVAADCRYAAPPGRMSD